MWDIEEESINRCWWVSIKYFWKKEMCIMITWCLVDIVIFEMNEFGILLRKIFTVNILCNVIWTTLICILRSIWSMAKAHKLVVSRRNQNSTIPHDWIYNTTTTNNDNFLKSILMSKTWPNWTNNWLKRVCDLSGYFAFVFVSLVDEFWANTWAISGSKGVSEPQIQK